MVFKLIILMGILMAGVSFPGLHAPNIPVDLYADSQEVKRADSRTVLLAIIQVDALKDPEAAATVIRRTEEPFDIIEITHQTGVDHITSAMVTLMNSHLRFGDSPPAPEMLAHIPRAHQVRYYNPERRAQVAKALSIIRRGQRLTIDGYGEVPASIYHTSVSSWVGGLRDAGGG